MRRSIYIIAFFCASENVWSSELFGPWEDPTGVTGSIYARQLELAGEGSLAAPVAGTTIRLIWNRSFHNPIIVRIDCEDECEIVSYRFNGKSGYGKSVHKVEEKRKAKLSDKHRSQLFKLVALVDLYQPQPASTVRAEDGAWWVIEVADGERYGSWATQGTSESQFASFNALFKYIVARSELDIPKDEFY